MTRLFFFSSRRRHTRSTRDWSSDVCSSDLRSIKRGQIRDWSPSRRLLSAAANAFVRVLFRLPARDCTSGFRAYRREVLLGVPWDRLHSTGYSFLVEVLYWAAHPPGRRVHEVPICFVDRKEGRSKMGLRQIVFGAA